jgi:hypothetical protein
MYTDTRMVKQEATLPALRVLLGVTEITQVQQLTNKLNDVERILKEANEACPVLFATKGDIFTHPRLDGICDMEPEVFEYLGRTFQSGKEPSATLPGWIIFRHVDGPWGIEGGHGAVNGGVRDVMGAWPMNEYRVYDDNGEYEHGVMCLPPEKCFGFRLPMEYDDYDEVVDSDN